MADTLTKNYNLVKPEPHASPTTWGDKLNSDLDLIDAQMNTNQVAIAAAGTLVGQVVMWAGATPPTNWWWCSGDEFSRTAYPALFAVLGTTYGAGDGSTTFNIPDMFGACPVAYDGVTWLMGATGGETAHTLTELEMASHTHGVNDPGHGHPIADPGHLHTYTQTPHTHGINDPGHAHPYSVPGPGGVGIGGGTGVGDIPGTTGTATTGITVQANYATFSIDAATTGLTVSPAPTNITIANEGGSQAHNNMQPYFVIGFIIRLI